MALLESLGNESPTTTARHAEELAHALKQVSALIERIPANIIKASAEYATLGDAAREGGVRRTSAGTVVILGTEAREYESVVLGRGLNKLGRPLCELGGTARRCHTRRKLGHRFCEHPRVPKRTPTDASCRSRRHSPICTRCFVNHCLSRSTRTHFTWFASSLRPSPSGFPRQRLQGLRA